MEETHTQMTTQQLDTMLAEAHRRGALEACAKIAEAFEFNGRVKWNDRGLALSILDGIRLRYELSAEELTALADLIEEKP